MITRLLWTTWTLLSAVPKKAVKLNHSLTHTLTLVSHFVYEYIMRVEYYLSKLIQHYQYPKKTWEKKSPLYKILSFSPWSRYFWCGISNKPSIIPWKIWYSVIKLLAIRSLQSFAHATTAVLSWHVQNFVVISSSEFGGEQNKIFIELELQ